MKIVTIKQTKHMVYESDTEFRQYYADEPIIEHLRDVQPLSWHRSKQGYIVQCLIRKHYVDNSRGTGNRKTPRETHYFKFPRHSKICRNNQLDEAIYYFPTSDKFVSEFIGDYPMAHQPKIKLFVEYVKRGVAPNIAYKKVYGESSTRRTAFLMSRKDIIDAIMHDNGVFMKEELEQAGMNKQAFAAQIVKIVSNDKENAVVRKWALETVNNIFNNVVPVDEEVLDPVLQASALLHNN